MKRLASARGVLSATRRRFSSSIASVPFALPDEINELREGVRIFAETEVAPWADKADKEDYFPRKELWQKFGEMGLHGLTVSEDYGGLNMGYLAHSIAMEEISRAAGGIGLSYGAHSNLCVNQLNLHGTPAQKEKYLHKLVTGEHVGALSMSEPNAGSDVMSMKTTAEEDGDYFVLNGGKQWCTNSTEADTLIVYAKTGGAKSRKITAFIVEKGFEGFSVGPKLDKFGMRGSPTAPLYFENCRVPKENILGQVNKGSSVLMKGLNYERLVLSGGPIGLMQAALDVTVPYVFERQQFGEHLGRFQLMQGKLADMYVALQSSRAYLYNSAMSCDQGVADNKNCAAVLLFCSENSVKVALEAIQCLGGNGYCNEYPTGRILRDAKLYDIGAGTNEIRRFIIGRAIGDEELGAQKN